MSIFDRFKKKEEEERLQKLGKRAGVSTDAVKTPEVVSTKKAAKPAAKKSVGTKADPKTDVKEEEKATTSKTVVAHGVLIRPIVTEKSTMLSAKHTYVFEVARDANKVTIRKAVADLYGVTPVKVRVINSDGKYVRYGKTMGQRRAWKKAMVTLKEGQSIQFIEGR